MSDQKTMQHIQELVREEQELLGKEDKTTVERTRLDDIQTELDQCWDFLRQRRAKAEFEGDPDRAEVRDEETVKEYLQ